jgi:hypothetical protein
LERELTNIDFENLKMNDEDDDGEQDEGNKDSSAHLEL